MVGAKDPFGDNYIVFLGKMLYSHSASPFPYV